MTALQRKNPAEFALAGVDTKAGWHIAASKDYSLPGFKASQLQAANKARRQARATGIAKMGKCVIAEMAERQDRESKTQAELLSHLRVKEIETLIRARHGVVVPDGRGTDDLDACNAYLMAVAGSRGEIEGWASRWLPWLDDPQVIEKAHKLAAKLARGRKGATVLRADAIARLLTVTLEERQRLGLKTIGACDVGRAERNRLAKELKRERDRNRQALKRKAAGKSRSREQFITDGLTAKKPWLAEGISRATWYRRQRETGVSRIERLCLSYVTTSEQPVSPRSQEGAEHRQDRRPSSLDSEGVSGVGINPFSKAKPEPVGRQEGSGDKSPARFQGAEPLGASDAPVSVSKGVA